MKNIITIPVIASGALKKLIRKHTMGFLFWRGFYFESFLSLKTCCLCIELTQV